MNRRTFCFASLASLVAAPFVSLLQAALRPRKASTQIPLSRVTADPDNPADPSRLFYNFGATHNVRIKGQRLYNVGGPGVWRGSILFWSNATPAPPVFLRAAVTLYNPESCFHHGPTMRCCPVLFVEPTTYDRCSLTLEPEDCQAELVHADNLVIFRSTADEPDHLEVDLVVRVYPLTIADLARRDVALRRLGTKELLT